MAKFPQLGNFKLEGTHREQKWKISTPTLVKFMHFLSNIQEFVFCIRGVHIGKEEWILDAYNASQQEKLPYQKDHNKYCLSIKFQKPTNRSSTNINYSLEIISNRKKHLTAAAATSINLTYKSLFLQFEEAKDKVLKHVDDRVTNLTVDWRDYIYAIGDFLNALLNITSAKSLRSVKIIGGLFSTYNNSIQQEAEDQLNSGLN